MVIVFAKITAGAGKRDAFIKAAQPCIATTRKEAGCLHYELVASTEHPDKLMFFERWTDRAALDAHRVSPHIAAFQQMKKEQGLQPEPSELEIYTVPE